MRKLILLAVTPTSESYSTICRLLKLLNLETIDFGYSMDLKMVLIACGKQSAAAKHNCPYCDGSSPYITPAETSTVGTLWSAYERFMSGGGNKKFAKDFCNVVNPPLVTGSEDTKLIDILISPELHILTGIP